MDNTIFSIWIQGDLDDISIVCIKSWIKFGYEVVIYTYSQSLLEHNTWKFKHSNLRYENANLIFDIIDNPDHSELLDTMGYAPLSDIFRLTKINKEGGTYLDTDMFLIRELPDKKEIIGSEYTNQSGAYKSSRLENPNFNVLRLPAGSPILQETIDKILKSKAWRHPHEVGMNSNNNTFMKIFQKLLFTEKYRHLKVRALAKAFDYSPIAWAYWKDIYQSPIIHHYKGKYAIDQPDLQTIMDKSIGIHLWRNLYRKNKTIEIHPNIYDKLKQTLIEPSEPKLTFCIPSFKRADILKEKTLAFLNRHGIERDSIYIFLNDYSEYDEYLTKIDNGYNFVITERQGIGATRSFILNNFFHRNKDIIMIDDDIEDIREGVNQKLTKSLDNLKEFCINYFKDLRKYDCYFGGIPLFDNPYFLKEGISTNLKYVSGAIQFHRKVIHRTPIELKLDEHYINHFEDYLCNIKYFLRDGKIMRKNNYFPITKNYNKIGGICEMEGSIDLRMEKGSKNANRIIELYPKTCSIVKKKGGLLNLRLNHFYTKTI